MTPSHHPSIYAPFLNETGDVAIGGRTIAELMSAAEVPHYFYSGDQLEARIAGLRAHMPLRLKLHYAIKSNSHRDVIKRAGALCDGFDIASGGEMHILEDLGVDMGKVSFAGPGKSRREIRDSITNGVTIIAESPHQLKVSNDVARDLGLKAAVMVRLNIRGKAGGGGLSMSGGRNGFGWDIEDYLAEGTALFAACEHVEFTGFHLFFGSQLLKAEMIEANLERSLEILKSVPTPSDAKHINLGGGLGIPYGPNDEPLDASLLTDIWTRCVDVVQGRWPGAEPCIELGRFIAGPMGLYATEILDKKTIDGTVFLICDGGMHHFSAATGNFGQAFKRNHPLLPAVNHPSRAAEKVTVIGCLCTPIDVFARDLDMQKMEIGEHLVMFQAGAYGASASPKDFLGHDHPREVFL